MRWFQRGAAYAAGKGVFLGFENHSDQTQISGNPELCAELCRRVGSAHFGVLYDPCNLMSFGTDYQQALRVFGPHVTHVHLKDGFSVGGAASGGWERCGTRSAVVPVDMSQRRDAPPYFVDGILYDI